MTDVSFLVRQLHLLSAHHFHAPTNSSHWHWNSHLSMPYMAHPGGCWIKAIRNEMIQDLASDICSVWPRALFETTYDTILIAAPTQCTLQYTSTLLCKAII